MREHTKPALTCPVKFDTMPQVKKADVLDAVSWSAGRCQGPEHVHYKLDGYVVRVPASSQGAFQMQVEAVQEAVDGLVSELFCLTR